MLHAPKPSIYLEAQPIAKKFANSRKIPFKFTSIEMVSDEKQRKLPATPCSGSITAETATGTFRFGSLIELKDFIERGA